MRLRWAQFGHKRIGHLLNDLVCPREQRLRDRKAKRLGGLEVDDELELRRLLHRQISRPGAFEDPIHVGGCAAHLVIEVDAIRHQPTALHEVTAVADRWKLLFQRQLCDGTRMGECQWRRQNDEAPVALGMETTKAVERSAAVSTLSTRSSRPSAWPTRSVSCRMAFAVFNAKNSSSASSDSTTAFGNGNASRSSSIRLPLNSTFC